ncbi:MAG: PilZ domain-containing protein [Armatimonadota bacterium]|nr:PilZ domain-containing protein [Armatimonadota bacterium]
MQQLKVGERVLVEVVSTGESYPGEVQALNGPTVRLAAAMRAGETPLPGTPVRVIFVRKEGLSADRGTVAAADAAAEPGLSIRLAGEPARTQRRDYVRQDASLNADLLAGDRSYRAVTKDVSGGGVSLLFTDLPPLGEDDEFDVVLNVPDGRDPIRARCRAKYVREVLRGSRWLVGSQFTAIADDDRQRLVRFVFRLELAQRRPLARK